MGMIALISDGDIPDYNELELDVDDLPNDKCRELDNYVKSKLVSL